MSQKWTFTQITSNEDKRKSLTLEGYNAPFGRPRKDPVIREVITVRVQSTVYPGSKDGPTRTVFGSSWEEVELKGRWMSKFNSRGLQASTTANKLADTWTQFVRDEQPITMSWGNIAAWEGFITRLELARESEHEIAWKLTVLIDQRNDAETQWTYIPPPKYEELVTDNTEDFYASMVGSTEGITREKAPVEDMDNDFLDRLNFFAGQLNQYQTQINKVASQLANIETRTFSTIQHFRSALTGFQTALVTMKEIVTSTAIDAAIVRRNAQVDLQWLTYQHLFDWQSYQTLQLLARADRDAEVHARLIATGVITANDNETWESLSTRATGNIGKAATIREMNGGLYGANPISGQTYLVP